MKLNKIELFWWDIGNVCNVPIREDSGWVLNGGYLEISRQTGIKVLFVAEVPFAAAKYLEVIGSSEPWAGIGNRQSYTHSIFNIYILISVVGQCIYIINSR